MKVEEYFWQLLLNLKSDLYNLETLNNLVIDLDYTFITNPTSIPSTFLVFISLNEEKKPKEYNSKFEIIFKEKTLNFYYPDNINTSIKEVLHTYIPLCLGKFIKSKYPFIMTHTAQTLDGKIATKIGDSKWISNEENQKHSHRLRAMSDGILIGKNTFDIDDPKLNVRWVKGEDPIRIIIGFVKSDFETQLRSSSAKIYIYSTEEGQHENDQIEYNTIKIDSNLDALLKDLKSKGIHTIILEGGSFTISCFLEAKKVDLYQVNISPILFGSGIPIIDLKNINKVDQCLKLESIFFTNLEDNIMVTGSLL